MDLDKADLLAALVQVIDRLLGGVRHELHDKAARGLDAAVRIHEHAERTRRAELVAFGEKRREVLGDLAAHERGGTGVRLAQADVAADREKALPADRAGDVELAVPLADGKIDLGVGDVAAHIAGIVRYRKDRADRPAALDAQRERGVVLLEHFAEERRAAERAAERRRADGVQMVDVSRTLDHVGRGDDGYFCRAVVRDGAKNLAHGFFLLRN